MKILQLVLLCGLALASTAWGAQPDYLLHVASVSPASPDRAIAHMLDSIEPAHIQQTVQTLVGFGTRSTLSSMETGLPPGQGINAAAD
jgi:hypothetical protein